MTHSHPAERGSAQGVTVTPPAHAERAIATIVLAFSTDPMARWSVPDPAAYLTYFPAIVRAFGGSAFAAGAAHHVDDFAGADLWLPPGIFPDEQALSALMQKAGLPERQADAAAVFAQMATYHPTEPHWYLPLIGVDPTRQGTGLGSKLLAYALQRCDAEHLPAYLESSNPVNIPLYERHGFERLGTIQAGSSPPLVPMLRPAR